MNNVCILQFRVSLPLSWDILWTRNAWTCTFATIFCIQVFISEMFGCFFYHNWKGHFKFCWFPQKDLLVCLLIKNWISFLSINADFYMKKIVIFFGIFLFICLIRQFVSWHDCNACYNLKQRSYKKMKLIFFSGGFYPGTPS